MGCCSCITAELAACVLRIVNSVLLAAGILLAVLGALLHFGGSGVYRLFSGLLASLASSEVGGISDQLGIADLEKILGNWSSIVSYAGIILLVVGVLLIALGILGWVGACCKLKIVMIVYVALTLALTLALAACIVAYVAFRGSVRDAGSDQMRDLLQQQYQGRSRAAGQNDFSRVMDIVQARLECCGVTNFTDFYDAGQWNRTYFLRAESRIVELVAPISCCKLSITTFEPLYANCTYSPAPSTSNFLTPCYSKLWDILDAYADVFLAGFGITAAVTGGVTLLTCIMLAHHTKNDVTPI